MSRFGRLVAASALDAVGPIALGLRRQHSGVIDGVAQQIGPLIIGEPSVTRLSITRLHLVLKRDQCLGHAVSEPALDSDGGGVERCGRIHELPG